MKKIARSTLFPLSLQLLIFVLLYYLTMTFWQGYYLLEWTARNYYLYLWLSVIVLTLFEKYWWSWIVTVSNIVALPLAQWIGDLWRASNMAKITPGMSAEQQYHLQRHHGWWIWILLLIIGFILGWIIQRKKHH